MCGVRRGNDSRFIFLHGPQLFASTTLHITACVARQAILPAHCYYFKLLKVNICCLFVSKTSYLILIIEH